MQFWIDGRFQWDLQYIICTEVKWTTAYGVQSNCLQPIMAYNYSRHVATDSLARKGEMENTMQCMERENRNSRSRVRVAVHRSNDILKKKFTKKRKNIGRLISNKTLSETNHTDGQRIHMSTKEYSMRITEMKAHKTVHTENACCIWTVHAILLA